MKLSNGVLRPGLVLDVFENGQIKASAPGLFDGYNEDLNPPINPFFDLINNHQNSYSAPRVGDEVWILNFADNPLQLYWFRKDNHFEHNEEIFRETGYANVEILCNLESGLGYASLFFSDGTGWVLRNNDSKLQIYPNGKIEMGMDIPHRSITIDKDSIKLGGETHTACYGDAVAEVLLKLCGVLEVAAKAAGTDIHLMPLIPAFQMISEVKSHINGIQSSHVKLD